MYPLSSHILKSGLNITLKETAVIQTGINSGKSYGLCHAAGQTREAIVPLSLIIYAF